MKLEFQVWIFLQVQFHSTIQEHLVRVHLGQSDHLITEADAHGMFSLGDGTVMEDCGNLSRVEFGASGEDGLGAVHGLLVGLKEMSSL